MRLLHLSDLHIGKRVNGFSMLEDQKYILAQIVDIAVAEMADGVLLAGDIYDKPVPSAEAVQLFDSFLTILADKNLPVFVISGNHDSAERLSFGAQLMQVKNVYISPVYSGEVKKVCMTDDYGEVCIWLLPFIKPSAVRHVFNVKNRNDGTGVDLNGENGACAGSDLDTENAENMGAGLCAGNIAGYQEALETVVAHMDIDTQQRNVLVAHQFVTGASRCESEEVSVGGLDNVEAAVFDVFDYVALGHIHSPQYVGRKTVRYCGTPLKYSFSEVSQKKSVTIVDMKEKGNVEIREIFLAPLHDMRKIRGTYMEVTARPFYENTDTNDYIQIILTDEADIPDGLQKLRVIYPNLMQLEYDNKRTRENRLIDIEEETEQKSELELFRSFYELQNNQGMSDEQEIFMEALIRRLKEREV